MAFVHVVHNTLCKCNLDFMVFYVCGYFVHIVSIMTLNC